ncbi:hypothetical protein L8T74_07525 [Campylobacter lari]|nr:hypothetical protein [Campylobacter lari]
MKKIKEKLTSFFMKFIFYLKISNINNQKAKQYKFSIPCNDIDSDEIETLKYAIDKKDVKNIAIYGEYGAGKTSLVKSFENKYSNKKLSSRLGGYKIFRHFLSIIWKYK